MISRTLIQKCLPIPTCKNTPKGGLLKLYPSDEMEEYPVSRRVNKPANNEPSVVEPAA